MIDDELRFNIVNYRLTSARNALGEVLSLSKDQYFNAAFIDAIEQLIKE